jgi:hypothetical protein
VITRESLLEERIEHVATVARAAQKIEACTGYETSRDAFFMLVNEVVDAANRNALMSSQIERMIASGLVFIAEGALLGAAQNTDYPSTVPVSQGDLS